MPHAELKNKTVLVTGSSGFIGFHLSEFLLQAGCNVIGIDNLSDYYDVQLKRDREKILFQHENFQVIHESIQKPGILLDILQNHAPDVIVHLAAQAGVRYSIEEPREYLNTNICGTFEVLEACKNSNVKHLLIASTSSAYGASTLYPYNEAQKADYQISFYAATKKATENMAHSYSHLFQIPTTVFRFFTVYGPWGRPDMALFKFTKNILAGEPIDVYNYGRMRRDFTYIRDLVEAISLLVSKTPNATKSEVMGDTLSPVAPYRLVNIGNSDSVELIDFIRNIEEYLGMKAKLNLMPMQQGDVEATLADTGLLQRLTGFKPKTDVSTGIKNFVDWYLDYYKG